MLARMVFSAAVVALVTTSAAAQEAKLFTLTNLHADGKRALLYSANYQQEVLIPACTEVKQLERKPKDLFFESNGVKYHYEFHDKTTPEGFDANVAKYFGPSCDAQKASMKSMSAADQNGIKAGIAMVGMTKAAVILAMGYPPVLRTPTTDADSWTYWRNRWITTVITFADGKVVVVK